MAAVHLAVQGRVQGVGFRWFVRLHARRLGLRGWVANRSDGTVEIAAMGDEQKLAELRSKIARGPDGAEVSGVVDLPAIEGELEFPFAVKKGG